MKRTGKVIYILLMFFLSSLAMISLAFNTESIGIAIFCLASAVITVYAVATNFVHYAVKVQTCEKEGKKYQGKGPSKALVIMLFEGLIILMIRSFGRVTIVQFIAYIIGIFAIGIGIWLYAKEIDMAEYNVTELREQSKEH